jgi:hypothetical protein
VRAVHDEFAEAFGQDSFLDILTNVVGIIILLVLMVGLRASHDARGMTDAQLQASAVPAASENELQEACSTAVTAERGVHDLVTQAVNVHEETVFRDRERAYLATFVTGVEQEIVSRRAKLSVDEQRDFDLRRQLADAQQTLDNLTREQVALVSQPAPVEVIENEPTPLARPSTGKELTLTLAEGHVAIVPVEELMKEAKKDVDLNLRDHLKLRDEYVNTVGPINGFRMRFRLRKVSVSRPRSGGVDEVATMVVPDRWEYLPTSAPIGEPVDQALLRGSELWQQLKAMSPDTSIVRMAVYPDSISDCHRLKQAFSQAGYATDEVPMQRNTKLVFSPYGIKTYAQ